MSAPMPVANEINLIEDFLPVLDEIYMAESKTAFLDADPGLVRETLDAKTILIPERVMTGLMDYNRNEGYKRGRVDMEWYPHKFEQDRGTTFTVDYADNLETAMLAFTDLGAEFIRKHVSPELDAYRISRYATLAGHTTSGALTAANVVGEITDAITALENDEVPTENMFIFMTPAARALLALNVTIGKSRSVDRSGSSPLNIDVHEWNDMPIITVPPRRMATEFFFRDGEAAGQEDGGFEIAPGAERVDFLILSPDAVIQIVKRNAQKIITPELNQFGDAWQLGYRLYHDAFVTKNRAAGIYAHTSPIV